MLFLYYRLFSPDRKMRILIILTGILCLAWWIAATTSLVCTCIPVRKVWMPLTPGHCFDYRGFYIAIETLNCILDF